MLNFKKTYILPFKFPIPSYIDDFLKNTSILNLWLKYLKRFLYISLKGQKSLEVFHISENHKNILWINFSAPSLGDSLMDLSSRVLLKNRKVDLLTSSKNAYIFESDEFFSSVLIDKNEVIKKTYDLVIIDSYSTRSIKIKSEVAVSLKYVGMYGYFNGPEVNRILFSFHQMNQLLGYVKSESEINSLAKCYMRISQDDQRFVSQLKLPDFYISIVIGGEWSYRSYNYWSNVIELLLKDSSIQIVIIGSSNAKDAEEIIFNNLPGSNLISFVGKCSFNQSAQIISKSMLVICCDGGLMHAANALETIVIPMFARLEAKMRLTQLCKAYPLFDELNVNNISVEEIILKYHEVLNFDYKHLQNE
jgi:ADP-heptose:LPS heptosyltransferase